MRSPFSHRAMPLFTVALAALPLLAAPAAAQQSSNGQGLGQSFTGLQLDSSKPISIDADQLDVDDKGGTATFTGDVHVAQGPTELRTTKLVVGYDKTAGDNGGQQQATSAMPGGSSQIRKLDATGKVYVKSSDQVATADAASFDMKSQLVVMTGNVVLSQGDNIAEGCKLTIQMQSGVARLQSKDCGGTPGGNNGRVRLMLTPDKKPAAAGQ